RDIARIRLPCHPSCTARSSQKFRTRSNVVFETPFGQGTDPLARSMTSIATFSPNVSFYVAMFAAQSGGISHWSEIYHVVLPGPTINAPGNLTATPTADAKAQLNWTNYSTYDNVYIERTNNGAGDEWQQVGVVGGTETSWQDEHVLTSVDYTYRVRGYKAGGLLSDYSQPADLTWPVVSVSAASTSVFEGQSVEITATLAEQAPYAITVPLSYFGSALSDD